MIASGLTIEEVLKQSSLDKQLINIADKVINKERLTEEEGVLLFEKGEVGYVGALANHIREQLHGNKVYFNRNFHIEPTNVCVFTCNFCSYSRQYKHRDEG
ncbi:MAG: aminofutalosine synthase MqnE, partial [Chitinophagaceae bacterium]|nr:aminofutalosine synthase MqnE [Chitinophagaceae bacterium]